MRYINIPHCGCSALGCWEDDECLYLPCVACSAQWVKALVRMVLSGFSSGLRLSPMPFVWTCAWIWHEWERLCPEDVPQNVVPFGFAMSLGFSPMMLESHEWLEKVVG